MIFGRCRARPRLRVALAVLGLLYLFAAAADFLAPYPEGAETSHLSFQPPNRVRVFREGQFVRPYIYALERTLDMETFEQVWLEDETQLYPAQVFVRRTVSATGVAERYAPFPLSLIPEPLRARWGVEPSASLRLFGVDDPGDRVRVYLWGADGFGGDVFGNILFGARVSLTLGLLAALITVPIGVLVGTLAAFAGGALRSLLLGLADALTAIPGVFWVLLLSSAFPAAAASTTATYFLLLGSIAAVGWGTLARGVDAQLRTLQREAFASAARALGNSEWRVVRRHLLPNTATYIVVSAGVLAPTFILLESLVSFFGLGVQAPARSWGLLTVELMGVSPQEALDRGGPTSGVFEITNCWWMWLPGVFLCLSTLSFVVLSEEVRDVLDPRA